MMNISDLVIIGAAYAQETAAAVPPSDDVGSSLMRFLPLFLIFAVFYLLLIRPQQKKLDAQTAMIKALKKGDRVITSGGIVGKVTAIEGDDFVMLEIADGVAVKVVRSTISAQIGAKDSDTPKAASGKKN